MIGLLVGFGAGSALLLAMSAFGVDTRLAKAWDRSPSQWTELTEGSRRGPEVVLGIVDRVVDETGLDDVIVSSGFAHTLAITGRDQTTFVAETLAKSAAAGLAAAVVVRSLWSGLGGGSLLAVIIAVTVGVVAVEINSVTDTANLRRSEMLVALAAMMEVTRLAAQTQSVEGALRVGIGAGGSWPFVSMSNAVTQASRLGRPPWDGLVALGKAYGMDDLTETGRVLASASSEGTGVTDSLRSRADVLGRRVTDHQISQAESRTEKLAVPMGGIAFGVVVLLISGLLLQLSS